MLLPLSTMPIGKIIGSEMVEVRPMGPPLNMDMRFTVTYDDTKWRLQQRLNKIEKLKEKIKNNNETRKNNEYEF